MSPSRRPQVVVGAWPAGLSDGVYVCGDHPDTPSIQGAMASGARAARAVLADLRPAAATSTGATR